jgi:hypothetical protein
LLVGSKPSSDLKQVAGVVGPVQFTDASAFAIPAPGDDGMGRNAFYGPKYVNLDLGLTKSFRIHEKYSVQVRAEAFNALNHPNFDNPVNSTAGSSAITSTAFGQVCCATVAPPATQTIIQTGESARIVQLALKIQF